MRLRWAVIAFASALSLMQFQSIALGAEVTRGQFGNLADGRAVELITLKNSRGICVRIITWGAAVQSLLVPDRRGVPSDVVLGFSSPAGYELHPQYFGASVGRFANRIAKGRFSLDGQTYQLATNDGPNSLHGGLKGFDRVLWAVKDVQRAGETVGVTLEYISPDGDQGYPGALTVTTTYSLNEQNELSVEYRATTDKVTIVNISNHSYFNLAGEGSAEGAMHLLLTLPADQYTPVDATLIPTGEIRQVAGTAFDFRQAKAIGRDIRYGREEQLAPGKGYDHNWVFSRVAAKTPRLVARVEDVFSGRVMEMFSNQPGLQFYSGNFLDGTVVGKSGRTYRQGDAIVLEPQLFPDTPNRPAFGSARLEPGDTYTNKITYRFSVNRRKK